MKNLTKGANAVLARSGTVEVVFSWKSPRIDLSASCFAVTASGKTPDKQWFLSHKQPDSPNGAIRFSQPSASQAKFVIGLDRLPPDIQKCVFAATLSQSTFREITEATITATPSTGEALTFKISDATNEQALVLAEIYRHGSDWKMRAKGEGFKGGFTPLAEYYGIQISASPSRSSSPPPSPPRSSSPTPASPPAPPSPPSAPEQSQRRVRRSGLSKKLIIIPLVALLILCGSVLGLAYYNPQLLFLVSPKLASLFHSNNPQKSPANATKPPPPPQTEITCALTDEQTLERYHALGENYIKINKAIDASNQHLTSLREDLKKIDSECPAAFVENNKKEIEQMEKLPVQGWIEETDRLNACAGIMIKKTDTDIQSEARPTILQRLLKNADRSRNLESDLTNISRDLAYLKNKADRLIKGFRSNLEACSK